MPCSIFESFEKYPSFLKGRFQGGENFYFSPFEKISGLPRLGNEFLSIVTMRLDVDRRRGIVNPVVEKIPFILLKEKIEGLIAKNFAVFRRISSLPKSGKLCLCKWVIVLFAGTEKKASEKISPHSSKGEIEGGIGKNFLLFEKICALHKLT